MPHDIPIIGEPQIGDWSLTINVTCTCKKTVMLVGKPGIATVVCECGNAYRILGMPTINQNGNLTVPLGFGKIGIPEIPK